MHKVSQILMKLLLITPLTVHVISTMEVHFEMWSLYIHLDDKFQMKIRDWKI